MEIFQNPNCKKIKGSHILEVSCAYCKCFIAKYQKVGKSNFVKMYNDRIIEGVIDFSLYHGNILPKLRRTHSYKIYYKNG